MTALTTRELRTAAELADLYCIRFERDNLLAMVGRLDLLLAGIGIPAMDFESRVSYLVGMYQSEKEMRHENKRTNQRTSRRPDVGSEPSRQPTKDGARVRV